MAGMAGPGAGAGGGAPASGGPGLPNEGMEAPPAVWTSAGGLSLDINLPQDGRKLTFSKSGGDARLALSVRPRASLEAGFGLLWTVLWLLVALWLIAALGRS